MRADSPESSADLSTMDHIVTLNKVTLWGYSSFDPCLYLCHFRSQSSLYAFLVCLTGQSGCPELSVLNDDRSCVEKPGCECYIWPEMLVVDVSKLSASQ